MPTKHLIIAIHLLLFAGAGPAMAQKSEITIKQVLKLGHFGNPYKVLKNANVQPITYQQGNNGYIHAVRMGIWD